MADIPQPLRRAQLAIRIIRTNSSSMVAEGQLEEREHSPPRNIQGFTTGRGCRCALHGHSA